MSQEDGQITTTPDGVQGTTRPRRFVFLLLDNFTLLSFASALEALRIANRVSNKPLYTWRILGENGGQVASSAGASFATDGDLEESHRPQPDQPHAAGAEPRRSARAPGRSGRAHR